jgi:4-alpha-glucanotransferase
MIKKRRSGILLHITSLPSPYGIGDFGPGACRFIDFLAEAKQSFWQILPLTPTDPISGNSPYRGSSAFAGNLLLISPELLVRDGLLSEKEIEPINCNQGDRINYHNVITYKERILDRAYECFKREKKNKYENFCSENSSWLDDFALFLALKSHWRGKSWN